MVVAVSCIQQISYIPQTLRAHAALTGECNYFYVYVYVCVLHVCTFVCYMCVLYIVCLSLQSQVLGQDIVLLYKKCTLNSAIWNPPRVACINFSVF